MYETEPTPEATQAIRDHLTKEHSQAEFDLHRDVAFRDNDPEGARINYLAETPGSGPRFACSDKSCEGRIFMAGEPTYGHPARNAWLLHTHPELRTTLLAGVRDTADQALLLEDWDRGRLGEARVTAVHKRHGMATKKADRPSVDERRTHCQEFMLERVREGAIVKDAIEALDDLRTDDPSAYVRLMGGPGARDTETLKKYWRAIHIAVRNAARTDGALARAATRAQKPAP